jgi:hypothetical protein
MRLDMRWIAASLATAALACAGGRPASSRAFCVLDRPAGAGEPDAKTWIALLLRGYDPVTHRVTSPPLDCTGAQVRWEGPALRCSDGAAATVVLPERPLVPADVVTSRVSDDDTLVWIAATHYATGDASGPVALVTSYGRELRAVALGVLRAYPEGVRLRLEHLGPTRVLVADGDFCTGDRQTCVRSSRVVPLRAGRFTPMPLVGRDGQCVSPAWFDLSRRERRRSSRGWERLEFGAEMAFSDGLLAVEERMVVQDVPRGDDRVQGRVLHRAQSSREVRWDRGRLVVSGTPLWRQIAQGEPR